VGFKQSLNIFEGIYGDEKTPQADKLEEEPGSRKVVMLPGA